LGWPVPVLTEGGADEAAPVALALVLAASGEFCAGPPVPVGEIDTLLEVPAVGGPGVRACVRNGIIA
jgi:hypothetical protein